MKNKLDLSAKVAGATRDVASFENNSTRLFLRALKILVALSLGCYAVKEFVIRDIRFGELQPFVLSSAAILISILFIISAVAMLREWTTARSLVLITGVSSVRPRVRRATAASEYGISGIVDRRWISHRDDFGLPKKCTSGSD